MPKFSKRHYEAVAEAIENAFRWSETDNQRRGVERAMNSLIATFELDNAAFDRRRFEEAARPPLKHTGQRYA